MTLSRRDLLTLGGLTLAGATRRSPVGPRPDAQARRHAQRPGLGSAPLRPDAQRSPTRRTSRCPSRTAGSSKHKAGPGVQPGTFPIEGDLAESWTQPNETTYVFKLRRGRALARQAAGERPRADRGRRRLLASTASSPSRATPTPTCSASVDKVEAVDKYTVKFTLKEPFAWFLDMLANPMAVAIVAKECVEKFGDLKKAEAVVGTGPWMLDSYRPNVGHDARAQSPATSCPGCRTSTGSSCPSTRTTPRASPRSSPASTTSAGSSQATINRTDWVQIKDTLKQRRPNLRTARVPVERHDPHLDADRSDAVQRRARPAGDVARHRSPGHHRRRRTRASGS